MAHICPICSNKCHCGGDIDDLIFENTSYCRCCEEEEDEDWDDEQNTYQDLLGY